MQLVTVLNFVRLLGESKHGGKTEEYDAAAEIEAEGDDDEDQIDEAYE